MTLDNFDPAPKNPVIASFFEQIGRSERLGSGTRKLYKFSRLYTSEDPKLVDGDFFDARVPVPDVMPISLSHTTQGEEPVGSKKERERERIVGFILHAGVATPAEMSSGLGIPTRTLARRLGELVKEGAVARDGRGPRTRYRLA